MKRATVLALALALGACTNRDGSTDWGRTLALGLGVGGATALVGGALSDQPRYGGGYSRGGYAPGYRGYSNGYRW